MFEPMNNAPEIAIIGGTGLTSFEELRDIEKLELDTPYGAPSAPVTLGFIGDKKIAFLPRHGEQHTLPPHKINYRANIFALKSLGAKRIVGVNAVGGIHPEMGPQHICIPDQIIDYTYGRVHTYSDGVDDDLLHIDFTEPYDSSTRRLLLSSAKGLGLRVSEQGTYACTQGPRLETKAEINRLERDGCDIVGMTGMPEAGLARELELPYASIALVVNWAAGRSEDIITLDSMMETLQEGMISVKALLQQTFKQL